LAYPYYTGLPERAPADPLPLPEPALLGRPAPKAYLPDPGLVDAVNVALVLGQPLLLTGEPGTGKTQLAWNLAAELGLGEPLLFETKSSSVARDLFYGFDTLRRFHAAHTGGSQNAVDYLTYHALGLAILLSTDRDRHRALLPPELARDEGPPRRSVVVIDEIDKAPRDFPNDLLNEIEHLYFRIPELANAEVRADPALRPVVVVTSNSEKHLPDAFLRRCVFYHLDFPDTQRLKRIVLLRLVTAAPAGRALPLGEAFLADAVALFEALRRPESGLRKKPGTAELLGWVVAMAEAGTDLQAALADQKTRLRATLGALVKDRDDQETARGLVERWPTA
jgi:MoxR-like ATPase